MISNEEINDLMKIVQALKSSGILLKQVFEAIKNETKEQKEGFLSMLLGTLGATLLGNLLTAKGSVKAGERTMRAGEEIKKQKALMLPHPLTNFEIREYYENELRFNGVYSRDNLPKTIKNGAYVINHKYADVGTYWIARHVLDCFVCRNSEVVYFHSFGVEHVSKKLKDLLHIKTSKQTFSE